MLKVDRAVLLARRSSGEGGLLDVKTGGSAAFTLASPTEVGNPPFECDFARCENRRFARSEIFKKSEKKACQLSGSSINEGKLRTNQLIFRSKIFSKK